MKAPAISVIFLLISTCLCAQNNPQGNAKDSVYAFTEEPPKFPGGDVSLNKFLSVNIRYPEKARREHIEGKALIKFVVTEDGSVSNVTVVRSVSPEIDAEAVRVIKLLPKFEPARQNGKQVKTYFNIPVSFRLTSPQVEEISTTKNRQLQNDGQSGSNSSPNQNVVYLQNPRYTHLEGVLMIEYTVNGGRIQGINVLQSLSHEIDSEAIMYIKRSANYGADSRFTSNIKTYHRQLFVFKNDTDEMGNMVKDLNFGQGLAELKLENFKNAINFFKLSIKQFPNDYLAYQYKGVCEANLLKIGQACIDFKKAKELGAKDVDTYIENNCR